MKVNLYKLYFLLSHFSSKSKKKVVHPPNQTYMNEN